MPQFLTPLQLIALASPPSSPSVGWTYFDTNLSKVQVYTSSGWIPIPADGGGGAGFTDAFSVGVIANDNNTAPADANAYAITLDQSDTNAEQSEDVLLGFPTGNFGDSSIVPTDGVGTVIIVWLNGSTGTSNAANPSNANGSNNTTLATLQTAAAGAATATLTSFCGNNVPNFTPTAATYRGYLRAVNTVVTSTSTIIATSPLGLFSNITLYTFSALTSTDDRLSGNFTFDLFAAGVNTLAKLQDLKILHRTTDAVAGVTPAVMTVDAGAIEVTMTI